MAFVLKIHIDDGSGTEIDLSANVSNYRPTAAPESETAVQEAMVWRQLGYTALSTPRNNLRDLSNALNQARRAQVDRIYPRVWLYFAWDGSDVVYRSPVYGGQITSSPRALQKGMVGNNATEWDIVLTRGNYWEDTTERTATIATDLADNHYRPFAGALVYNTQKITAVTGETIGNGDGGTKTFTGTLAGKPIWFQDWADWYLGAPRTITLGWVIGGVGDTITYPNLSAVVTAFTINRLTGAYSVTFATAPDNATLVTLDYSHGYGNAIEFAANKFVDSFGDNDLPTPLKLELTNESATYDLKTLYLAMASAQQQAYPNGILYFDGPTVSGGSSTADTGCTLGTRRDLTITTTESKLWTSESFQFADTPTGEDGRYYVPIIRFSPTANTANIDDMLIRWKLISATTSGVLYESEQYRPPADSLLIQPVGYVQVAPWPNMSQRDQDSYKLEFWGQSTTGGSITASLDFVELMPTDAFCRVTVTGADAVQEDETLLLDAGLREAAIISTTGTVYRSNLEVLYGWPEIKPGYADGGYLYLLYADDSAFTAPIDWPLSVTVKYRPRRRLL